MTRARICCTRVLSRIEWERGYAVGQQQERQGVAACTCTENVGLDLITCINRIWPQSESGVKQGGQILTLQSRKRIATRLTPFQSPCIIELVSLSLRNLVRKGFRHACFTASYPAAVVVLSLCRQTSSLVGLRHRCGFSFPASSGFSQPRPTSLRFVGFFIGRLPALRFRKRAVFR